MSQLAYQSKEKTKDHYIRHPSKKNRHTDVVLLHRELHLNLNRHIRNGRALKKTSEFGVVYTKYQQALDKRQNVLGSLSPLKIG